MEIVERISADLKTAMRARDQVWIDTLRSALSAFSYRKIEAKRDLTDPERIEALRKLVKQRGDSIVEFERAGRAELAAKEARERDLLSVYLPAAKSPEEIRAIVRSELAALPEGQRNEGGAMKVLIPKLRGDADGAQIRAIVKEELATT